MEPLIIYGAVALSLIAIILSILLRQKETKLKKAFHSCLHILGSEDIITHLRGKHSKTYPNAPYRYLSKDILSSFSNLYDEQIIIGEMLNLIDTGLIILDRDRHLRLINKSARQILSVNSEEDLSGLTLAEVTRDNAISNLVSYCIDSDHSQKGITELLYQRRHFDVSVTPLEDCSENYFAITLSDSTQSQLIDNSQREFVSNVSHELRNPLASVKAMVETLEEGSIHDKEVAINFLGRISNDIERMNNLVNDLLELSRIESGTVPLELQRVDLLWVLQEIVSDASVKHAGASIDIRTNNDLKAIAVLADEGRLRQIFINLIENAVRFTDKGGSIKIGYLIVSNMVEIHVKDTGSGISAEHHNRIFDRFYKVEKARREVGTGLGLSIVREIVESHGGTVAVQSEEGIGSDFYFTLPIAGLI